MIEKKNKNLIKLCSDSCQNNNNRKVSHEDVNIGNLIIIENSVFLNERMFSKREH